MPNKQKKRHMAFDAAFLSCPCFMPPLMPAVSKSKAPALTFYAQEHGVRVRD